MEHEARRRAEALDRYWDELIADPTLERPADVDEVHAATVRDRIFRRSVSFRKVAEMRQLR